MPRRPEIGNVQLYPNRPLNESDRNGYVLKFYCPIRQKRVRVNCGTRDRREARRIHRECGERLINGEYAKSGGAISDQHKLTMRRPKGPESQPLANGSESGVSWQDAVDRYRQHRSSRVRPSSLEHALSRLSLAEKIFERYRSERNLSEGINVADVMTLEMLEYLQDRLIEGESCRYERRSANTVNSMMGAVMAFVRYCHKRGWIAAVPSLQKFDVDQVMKGRPVIHAEYQQMVSAVTKVVGSTVASSWQFALSVLWESGFRVGDLMDFHWDDERHIHPVWPTDPQRYPTVVIPSTQKNGRTQEIPMLPGLAALLNQVPAEDRHGWIVNPQAVSRFDKLKDESFRPSIENLSQLVTQYSNSAIARACRVSETAVRKWLRADGIARSAAVPVEAEVPASVVAELRERSKSPQRDSTGDGRRLTTEYVGRTIASIGEAAGVVVQQEDKRTGKRIKYASAHDLRRGCALRLINAGVSAETLKVVMRHKDFATTEKHYGAMRSAQSAASEVHAKLTANATNDAFVGGLVGGTEPAPQLSQADLAKIKRLLETL